MSETLGIKVQRIVRYRSWSDAMAYVTRSGTFRVRRPWSQRQLSSACRQATGHEIPRISKKLWEVAIAAITRVSIVYDMQPLSRNQPIDPELLIGGYLAIHPFSAAPAPTDAPHRPFERDELIHINRIGFEGWRRRFLGTQTRLDEVLGELRRRGWTDLIQPTANDQAGRAATYLVSPRTGVHLPLFVNSYTPGSEQGLEPGMHPRLWSLRKCKRP